MGRDIDDKYWSFSGVGGTYSMATDSEAGEVILTVSATASNKAILSWGGICNFKGSQSCEKGLYFVAEWSVSNPSDSFSIGLRADDSNYSLIKNVGGGWYAVCANQGVTSSNYIGKAVSSSVSYTYVIELTTHSAYFIAQNNEYWTVTNTGSSYNRTTSMEPYICLSTSNETARSARIQYIYILGERHYHSAAY